MARRKKRVIKIKRGEPATFFRRFAAYFLDTIIIGLVITLPFGYAYGSGMGSFEALNSAGFSIKTFLLSMFIAGLTVLYWAILEYKLRQSIGKMILGIYVKPLTKKFTFWQALLRNLTKISSLLLILDCVYMFCMKTNQRFMETLAETEVLRKWIKRYL